MNDFSPWDMRRCKPWQGMLHATRNEQGGMFARLNQHVLAPVPVARDGQGQTQQHKEVLA